MESVIANRYRLGEELGAGGMARVVVAHDLRLDRRVAVKLVPVAGIDRAGRERFVREARSSAGFSHPNAVAVYDAGESDSYLYLVMELVAGPSLAERIGQRGPLDLDDALHVTRPVLAALGAAHEAGIVHRDVKPGNILLGPAGQVKLADFGIAKRLGDMAADLTGSGQFVGTPKYLAPEQVVGEPATPATDIYAVGVVLFEMLAGRPPYDAGNPVATAIAHRDAPIPDLHRARPDVPDHVVAAVRRAMAKEPIERFASAEQMAAALAQPTEAIRPYPMPVSIPPGAPPLRPPEPTQVMVAPPSRRPKAWWWAAAAGLTVGGGVARDRPAGRHTERLGRSARPRLPAGRDHDRRSDHHGGTDDGRDHHDQHHDDHDRTGADAPATSGVDRGAHRPAGGRSRSVRTASARLPRRAPRRRRGERTEAG